MLVKPENMSFKDKKICMIIAGVAGIGKTTLALSSPSPLLIDLDKGIDRVETLYRTDALEVKDYYELIDDLSKNDLTPYKTIVIDTGGKLLEMLKPVVINENAQNGKRNGDLSLQGYGAVKKKFREFIDFIKKLDKHLILIFHATEVNLTDDIIGLRIRMEGSSKDEIWDNVDLGGFIEMRGKNRTIGFSNCERYYAKGTHGISGVYEIPTLNKLSDKNDFITQLFNSYLNQLEKEQIELKKYKELMNKYTPLIENINSKESYNNVINLLKSEKEFPLTCKDEIWARLKEKTPKEKVE